MLTSFHLHEKSSEVSIKTRSTPASLSIQDQDTKHTTVKWPIGLLLLKSGFDGLFSNFKNNNWLMHQSINQSIN